MDPALSPNLLPPGHLCPHPSRVQAGLMADPPRCWLRFLSQRCRVKVTLWPPLGHSVSPSCPVPWFACLPTGPNHSSCARHCPGACLQDFLGLRGIEMVISHNLSKLLIQEYVFSLLGLHLAAQSMSTKIYSWYFLSAVNSIFPGTLG